MPQCNAGSEAIFNALELSGVSGQKIDDGAAGCPEGECIGWPLTRAIPSMTAWLNFLDLLLIPLPEPDKE
jgi:hypothetical protein